jgi:HD-like signal output (HDOD) protein
MSDISDLFKSVVLPVMPEVGVALINTLDQPGTSMDKIRSLISRDPTLSAKLLALANSAAFGLPRRVDSLEHAIKLVGLSRIRTLALSACLHNAFSMPEGIDSTDFWRYSTDCAGYAQWLATGLDDRLDIDSHGAWLIGLMLRLGELIIGHSQPDMVESIEQQPCAPGERWRREHATVGFDEGEVTAELARRWNFPSEFVHALAFASSPMVDKPVAPLAGIVHLASLLADQPDANAETIDTLPVPVMEALALKYGWMKSTFPDPADFINVAQPD